ncbi:MAG: iron-containing alcohol dehydrogenase [Planctomycetes bacterium]|nr:iron-containing alcohol dehydrogenase [Planctomycetota bacterium]
MLGEAFEFGFPTRVVYGPGSVDRLGDELRELGAGRPFVLVGPGLAPRGLPGRALAALSEAGLEAAAVVLAQGPAPDVDSAARTAAALAGSRADAVVALGGDGALDEAKAAITLAGSGGDLRALRGTAATSAPLHPLVAIPTAGGGGGEASPHARLRDPASRGVLLLSRRGTCPALAVLDPELGLAESSEATAAGGLDAMAHALEALVSLMAQPFGDALAAAALGELDRWLVPAVRVGSDLEARGHLLVASAMAGAASGAAGTGVVHAMAHALEGRCGLPHAATVGLLLPHGVRYNAARVPGRYLGAARALGLPDGPAEEAAERLARRLEGMAAEGGLPARLRDLGLDRGALAEVAEAALVDASIFSNPRAPVDAGELVALFEGAW